MLVFFVYPVTALVARGFHDESGWTLEAIRSVLASRRTWRVVGQTLAQAAIATGVSVLLGLPAAHLLYCRRWAGRRLVRAVVAIPFVLPSVVVGVAFRAVLAPTGPGGWLGWEESLAGVVAALVFFNYSVVVRTVGVFWARLDQRPADAAHSLGASNWRVFATITLPALAPPIAAAAGLVFLFCATAFGVVLVLGGVRYGTLETEIYYRTTQLLDLPAAAGLSILQLVVVAASLLLAGRARQRHERALQLTSRHRHRPLGRSDLGAGLVTGVVVVILILVPLGTLVARSFVTSQGISLANYRRLGSVGPGLSTTVWQATVNSLLTGVVAMAIALVLGSLIAYVLSRQPRSAGGRTALKLADAGFMLPLGVSAVTVGFGFLITLNRPPLDLRASWILIPIAQAMVALPLVIRSLLPTWRAIDPRLRQAAASLGATNRRILATIEAPYLGRAFGLAAGFAFATSLGEFGATSFLSRPDRPTLPVVVYRLISRPGADNFGTGLAAAVVLAGLTALIMALAEWFGPKEASW